ncbi:MAG: ATP-binding cassette domain-containing protein, partial [Sarcina sp.]
MLKVRGLCKEYSGNGNTKALDNINFFINKGEFVSIIGPSGAGKSTLLRCLNRMIDFSGGEVEIDGKSIGELKGKDLKEIRTNIGMIFQHYNLVERLSVLENVLHGRLGYKTTLQGIMGSYTESEKEKALELLGKLGLTEQAYKRCDNLSG